MVCDDWGKAVEDQPQPAVKWLTYEQCLMLNVDPLGRSDLRSQLKRVNGLEGQEPELRRVWLEDDVKRIAAAAVKS